MRNFSEKSCRENQNTYFMSISSFSKNCAIYKIVWRNMVQPYRPQMTILYSALLCMLDN